MYDRIFNFSAGPSMLPVPVLEKARDEMLNCQGSGMSVNEMSHRSKVFDQIAKDAEALVREVLGVPDNYKVLFMQGGATLQFACVPLNLMRTGKADYILTGNFSKKAYVSALTRRKLLSKDKVVQVFSDLGFSFMSPPNEQAWLDSQTLYTSSETLSLH